jgi:competence protein ComEA
LPGSLDPADEASEPIAGRDVPLEPPRWTYRRAWWAFLDSGRRGVAVLIAVAVVAAVVATVGFWRSRPSVVPIGGLSPRPAPAAHVAAAPATAAAEVAAGARPGPAGASATASTTVLVVDVAGKVRHPGLVRLPPGARVADAVAAAGGPLPHARLGLLNLASPLSDGEQVVVGLGAPPVSAGSAASAGSASIASGSGSGAPPSAPVDVNTATAEQLDTLPRVGPVLAQRIIDFRTAHGLFRSVDELEQVPGIGPSTMADLRGLVTV